MGLLSPLPVRCLPCMTKPHFSARSSAAGLGNGILLGYLMWRSRLLPRPMVMFGLIGGPVAFLGGIGVLLGAWDNPSRALTALTVLEVIWEFSLSVWLLIRGFRPSPILTGQPVAIPA
jgi:Domain of unknown function (DUF4386)